MRSFNAGGCLAAPANDANRILLSRAPQGPQVELVDHSGNGNGSHEEVTHITALVSQLLRRPHQRARLQGGQLVVEDVVLGPA
jgi:hypothetical protein